MVKEWVEEIYPKVRNMLETRARRCFGCMKPRFVLMIHRKERGEKKEKTPVVKTSCQRLSINAISALSNKCGFWHHVYNEKFTADKCIECFKRFLRKRKFPVILIVDGHPAHKSKKVMEYIESQEGRWKSFFFQLTLMT